MPQPPSSSSLSSRSSRSSRSSSSAANTAVLTSTVSPPSCAASGQSSPSSSSLTSSPSSSPSVARWRSNSCRPVGFVNWGVAWWVRSAASAAAATPPAAPTPSACARRISALNRTFQSAKVSGFTGVPSASRCNRRASSASSSSSTSAAAARAAAASASAAAFLAASIRCSIAVCIEPSAPFTLFSFNHSFTASAMVKIIAMPMFSSAVVLTNSIISGI
mmetsp:Transcript_44878/g.65599  ORF Transcript_44878/g.65599 Transcript_44878/m.65599 type:complete len:219 (-) Transcript_44878:380-1036(-)